MCATRAGSGRSPGKAAQSDAGPPGLDTVRGRARVVVERVRPQVDGGRFPAKREVGDVVDVEADVFADGHDELSCELRWRRRGGRGWSVSPMVPLGNDRWRGSFEVPEHGRYEFSLRACVDPYGTWLRDTQIKAQAGLELSVELLVGAELLETAARRAKARQGRTLHEAAETLRSAAAGEDGSSVLESAAAPTLRALTRELVDPESVVTTESWPLDVERRRARAGAWYEMFPRSAASEPGRHGTFADVERRLDYVCRLGFDVLYLPPVHPIGRVHRKGRDGAESAAPDDPGSPWAIGAEEGGHTAVHPELGTLEDLRHLVEAAGERGIEVALDLALQCAPDHPWVKEHPEWFRRLPDGSIRYAENPPKRYQDIYPLDFETPDWKQLWAELLTVVRFWVAQGVRIFRVDNPHTKPLAFWEWLIAAVKAEEPDVLFLAEAFTRPAMMHRLAKIGFSQSYTYFAWRNSKWELEQYMAELHDSEGADYFRPNLWPNTPDILTEALQRGGRGAFMARLVLAATMASSYGIYGPPFELQEHEPRGPGSEEYLHSEKYEIRHWDLGARHSLADFVARVNAVRRANPALQFDRNLRVWWTDNEALVAFSRCHGDNRVLVVVNVDPYHRQSGWVSVEPEALGLGPDEPYQVHDQLTDARFQWQGARNFVMLDPAAVPAHVLVVESLPGQPSEPDVSPPPARTVGAR
jgi:starch synthase (maltosyl-transferring)